MKKLILLIILSSTFGFASEGIWEKAWSLDLDSIEEGVTPQGFPNIDSEGNLYVLDIRLGALHKFQKDGTHTIIGKKGQGPTELAMALGFALLENGHIAISDAMTQSMKIYDNKGMFIENKRGLSGGFPTVMYGSKMNVYYLGMQMKPSKKGLEMTTSFYRLGDDKPTIKEPYIMNIALKNGRPDGMPCGLESDSPRYGVSNNGTLISGLASSSVYTLLDLESKKRRKICPGSQVYS